MGGDESINSIIDYINFNNMDKLNYFISVRAEIKNLTSRKSPIKKYYKVIHF